MRLKIGYFIGVALSFGWMASGTLNAQEGATGSPQAQQPVPSATSSQLITTSAKVQNLDMKKREVTLASDDGRQFTIEVPKDVKGLENVKTGDRVDAKFYESVAVSLVKADQPLGATQRTMRSQTGGALPGGVAGRQITATAKITRIDPSSGELTIQSSSGQPHTIQVTDPDLKQELNRLKVGDKVRTTYTEAMAAEISSAHSM